MRRLWNWERRDEIYPPVPASPCSPCEASTPPIGTKVPYTAFAIHRCKQTRAADRSAAGLRSAIQSNGFSSMNASPVIHIVPDGFTLVQPIHSEMSDNVSG